MAIIELVIKRIKELRLNLTRFSLNGFDHKRSSSSLICVVFLSFGSIFFIIGDRKLVDQVV